MLPSLFVSHGAPTLPMTDAPAKTFLEGLAGHLPQRPKAILVISAHWETAVPTVNAVDANETIHDFGGFPRALYELQYAAPGSQALAQRVGALLSAQGLACAQDTRRGLDHGAWTPLLLAFPDADIPVVQLSVQSGFGPAYHLALGRTLQPLREEGVLILGSGSFTHDLSQFRHYRQAVGHAEPEWVSAFADWFDLALSQNRTSDLLDYRRLAPFATRNHPTEEHLLPLYVALGAGGADPRVERLHASTTHGVLRMDVYSFGVSQ
ncbi:DODA-type extradiol aromatic ring-opening family dioxygenase [Caulobacter endophyticus]|uniref:Dioxygenase n=1 Tax=Caulobacter endophyticus TaxID=2172652 RepID=A0A2T9JEN3_9CAUL|nr:class III extradiol ring-cleavage dioxygenase [Caulobacter endophyticus]PVM82126.1 dioxygenase [Caulobacter endophyticus]